MHPICPFERTARPPTRVPWASFSTPMPKWSKSRLSMLARCEGLSQRARCARGAVAAIATFSPASRGSMLWACRRSIGVPSPTSWASCWRAAIFTACVCRRWRRAGGRGRGEPRRCRPARRGACGRCGRRRVRRPSRRPAASPGAVRSPGCAGGATVTEDDGLEDGPQGAGHVGEHLDGELAGAVHGESRSHQASFFEGRGHVVRLAARSEDDDASRSGAPADVSLDGEPLAGARSHGQRVEVGQGVDREDDEDGGAVGSCGARGAAAPDTLGALAVDPVVELGERRIRGGGGELGGPGPRPRMGLAGGRRCRVSITSGEGREEPAAFRVAIVRATRSRPTSAGPHFASAFCSIGSRAAWASAGDGEGEEGLRGPDDGAHVGRGRVGGCRRVLPRRARRRARGRMPRSRQSGRPHRWPRVAL